MSISFNEKDFNIIRIRRESKLFNLVTKYEYRIYGLRQEDNPPILISAQEAMISEAQEKILMGFMRNNQIEAEIEDCDSSDRKIYIGVRHDVRENVLIASGLLQTIIYFCEGRVELSPDYVVGNHLIPNFKNLMPKPESKAEKAADNR